MLVQIKVIGPPKQGKTTLLLAMEATARAVHRHGEPLEFMTTEICLPKRRTKEVHNEAK